MKGTHEVFRPSNDTPFRVRFTRVCLTRHLPSTRLTPPRRFAPPNVVDPRSMPFLGFKADGVHWRPCSARVIRSSTGEPKPRGVGGSSLRTDWSMPFPGSRGQPSILRTTQSPRHAACTTHLGSAEEHREAGATSDLMAKTVTKELELLSDSGPACTDQGLTALRASLFADRIRHRAPVLNAVYRPLTFKLRESDTLSACSWRRVASSV